MTDLETAIMIKNMARETVKQMSAKAKNADEAKLIAELMKNYDQYKEKWVKEYGTEKGFDAWFTKQVTQKR